MVHYDINDEELLNERNYGVDYVNRGHPQMHSNSRHNNEDSELLRERERDNRYPSSNQPPQSSRREREEYSPHRGGGNSRRVLNAM